MNSDRPDHALPVLSYAPPAPDAEGPLMRWASIYLLVWGVARVAEAVARGILHHRLLALYIRYGRNVAWTSPNEVNELLNNWVDGLVALALAAGAAAALGGWKPAARLIRAAAWAWLPIVSAEVLRSVWMYHARPEPQRDVATIVVLLGTSVPLWFPILILASVPRRGAGQSGRRPGGAARRIAVVALAWMGLIVLRKLLSFNVYLRYYTWLDDPVFLQADGRIKILAIMADGYLALPLAALACVGAVLTLARVSRGAAVLRAASWCLLVEQVLCASVILSADGVRNRRELRDDPVSFASMLIRYIPRELSDAALPLAILWFVRRPRGGGAPAGNGAAEAPQHDGSGVP